MLFSLILDAGKAKQAEAQSELWTDERGYYFLNIMVVLPGQQGKGIGKELAQEITKRADKEGMKVRIQHELIPYSHTTKLTWR